MRAPKHIGLDQAGNELARLVALAQAASSTIITRLGRPCAALVPLDCPQAAAHKSGLLSLRGTGAGLWGRDAATTVIQLRDEWN
jgi:antitoxin (DNA-binding transcriptional repressor) of toxin-antitoxin stability system